MYHPKLLELTQQDTRYAYEAYEFVFHALSFTQKRLGRDSHEAREASEQAGHHVTGPELLDGIREFALHEFGLLARTVFKLWGIDKTGDFGELVFNLVEANLLSKTKEDCREDFQNIYDLDEALVNNFRIEWDDED